MARHTAKSHKIRKVEILVIQSIIVNMAYIKRISKNIELKIGKSLNIPRSNLNRCKEFYWNYCQKKMKWG